MQAVASNPKMSQGAQCSTGSCDLTDMVGGLLETNVSDSERAVSGVAGAAMLLMAPRSGMASWLMTTAALGLMFRAATGHCFLYQAMGENTAAKSD